MFDIDVLKNSTDCTGLNDDELLCVVENARNFVLAYTNRTVEQWLPFFDSVACCLATSMIGKFGVEGAKRWSEGAISGHFLTYKEIISPFLDSYRLVKFK